jgi:hypothetical protein
MIMDGTTANGHKLKDTDWTLIVFIVQWICWLHTYVVKPMRAIKIIFENTGNHAHLMGWNRISDEL